EKKLVKSGRVPADLLSPEKQPTNAFTERTTNAFTKQTTNTLLSEQPMLLLSKQLTLLLFIIIISRYNM
ncbi:3465_t:CDS:1, partial [Racocetra persica]